MIDINSPTRRIAVRSPGWHRWTWLVAILLILWSKQVPAVAAPMLRVVVSNSILVDWVETVGQGRVEVISLVGPNQDAHGFQPKPSDLKRIAGSQLMLVNGLGFDPWATKLAASAKLSTPAIVSRNIQPLEVASAPHGNHAQAHHHGHGHSNTSGKKGQPPSHLDPHFWQDPTQVILAIQVIEQALAAADPAGQAVYAANSKKYQQELVQLDQWILNQVTPVIPQDRRVFTNHDAFGYFGRRYGVQLRALHWLSGERELTGKQVARIVQQIKAEKVRWLYVENLSNTKWLDQIAKDTNTQLGPKLYSDALSTPDQPANTYLKMMRYNVTQMVAGWSRVQ